jgi:NAD/NADP transhydrogenase alpha subunit
MAAVLLGTLNVVGGWVVTDRMLQMFRRRPTVDAHKAETPPAPSEH